MSDRDVEAAWVEFEDLRTQFGDREAFRRVFEQSPPPPPPSTPALVQGGDDPGPLAELRWRLGRAVGFSAILALASALLGWAAAVATWSFRATMNNLP